MIAVAGDANKVKQIKEFIELNKFDPDADKQMMGLKPNSEH
jgi:hypothetical protein